MDIEVTVLEIRPATEGQSQRGPWQRQEVICEIPSQSQYQRKLCVTFFNRPDDVKTLAVGQKYNFSIDIESREYNGRWYTDVRAWRIQPAVQAAPAPAAPQYTASPAPAPAPVQAPMPTAEPAEPVSAESDDLPF